MNDVKISIITVVLNRKNTIKDTINSVHEQEGVEVEHVIVDGGSCDGTLEIIQNYHIDGMHIISEKDGGIYDALNKGIMKATGEIIGILHSDDIFIDSKVLIRVAKAFSDSTIQVVYGDLEYIERVGTGRRVRYWRSCTFKDGLLQRGWMPPHPTVFLRKKVLDSIGCYDSSYRISADYDFLVRCFSNSETKSRYIPELLVKMRLGGESNRSLRGLLLKMYEDYQVISKNKIGGFSTLFLKNVTKLKQFYIKK